MHVIANHIPVALAKKFVPIFRQHRWIGEAETLDASIKREERDLKTQRTRYSDDNYGSVYVRLPEDETGGALDPEFYEQLAAVLKGERTQSVRAFYLECVRMVGLLTSDDPQVSKIEQAPAAILKYLNANCKTRGWLYGFDQDDDGNETIVAYLPIGTDYHSDRNDRPYVTLTCVYNGVSHSRDDKPEYNEKRKNFSWYGSEVTHRKVSEILRAEKLYAESDELNKEYDAITKRFNEVRRQHNELFRVVGFIEKCSGGWQDRTYWGTQAKPAMVVNDESMVKHRPSENAYSSIYVNRPGVDAKKGLCTVPWHPYMYGFDLGVHEEVWVHASLCQEFVYLDIADKLVLPDTHSELVDAVVHDLGFVGKSDIVGDKGAGTPVLSIGKPGEGKTLLAEVVSHRLRRPLYKLNAGYLLGDDNNRVANVEATLEAMLKRSERQKLIPLIDEADVMIAERSPDNLTQAAVVAAFLRTLEYFNGLLFLTSNRQGIDDAILSRMAAVIRFQPPTQEAREKIWRIQCEAQGAKLSAALIAELAKVECSGRDINRLLSLALRYERAGKAKLGYHLFERIAAYRGIDWPVMDGAAPPKKRGK